MNPTEKDSEGRTPTPLHKSKQRRRPPSLVEQERRRAWGREFGPKVGQMIRQSIARAER